MRDPIRSGGETKMANYMMVEKKRNALKNSYVLQAVYRLNATRGNEGRGKTYPMLSKCIHRCNTLSVTISVRIPRDAKEKLKKLKINVSEEVRAHLLDIIERSERLEKLRETDEKIRRSPVTVPKGTAAELIREDRDSGH